MVILVVSSLDFMKDVRVWKSLSLYMPEMRFSKVFVSSMPRFLAELF